MSVTDFVWIAIGETLLAATFALGILVGVSLTKKGISHGYGNEGTSQEWWHHIERRRAEDCARGCKPGCAKPSGKAGPDERASR
jgi:hypothetical protein